MRKMMVFLMMLFCMFSVVALAASENTTEFTLQGGLMSNLKRAHVNPFLFTQLRHCDGEMITPEEQDTFRAGDKLCLDNDATVDMSRVKEFFAFANSGILAAKTTKVATAPSTATVKITPAISAPVVIKAVKKSEPKPAIRTSATAPRKMTDDESSVIAVRRANAGCVNSLEKIEDCRARTNADLAKAQARQATSEDEETTAKKRTALMKTRGEIVAGIILGLALAVWLLHAAYTYIKIAKLRRIAKKHNLTLTPQTVNHTKQWVKDTAKVGAQLRKNLGRTPPTPSTQSNLEVFPNAFTQIPASTAPAPSPILKAIKDTGTKPFIPGRSQRVRPQYNWHVLSEVAEMRLRKKKIDGFAVKEQSDGLTIHVPSEAALEAAELSSHLQLNSTAPITVNRSAVGNICRFELKADTSLQYA